MKHLTYSDKSVLVGDEIADLLVEYAAVLATRSSADTVFVHAISSDGDEVEANLLLGPGAPLMTETTTSTLPEPDNAETERDVRQKIQRLTAANEGGPVESAALGDDYETLEYDDGH